MNLVERSVLPVPLRDSLRSAARKLRRGAFTSACAADLKLLIARLPLSGSVQAMREIKLEAKLWSHPNLIVPVPFLRRIVQPFSRQSTEIELLDRTSDLEYLYLFHGNGFCREAALHRIHGPLPGPFFVAALIHRLNDWVPQVRRAAAECLLRTARLTKSHIVAAAALHLLVRIESWRRWHDEVEALDEVLAIPDIAKRLAVDIAGSRVGAMSRVLRAALRRPALDPYLPSFLCDAHQPAVRAVALVTLLDAKARWPSGQTQKKWVDKSMGLFRHEPIWLDRPIDRALPLETLLEIGTSDRSAAVRRIAASGLIAHFDAVPGAQALAERLAGDPNPSVRVRARFALDRCDRDA